MSSDRFQVYQAPKISIVMPTFNHVQFIERSLRSVLDQNYPNLQLIVIDGASTDGTIEIIKKYSDYIAYWVSEPDGGQSDALNKGFSQATGDIFGWLNSDDLYMPGSLARAASVLAQYPQINVVFGDWLNIDSEDNVLHRDYAFDFNLNHFKYEGFFLNAQAMFWRKSVHKRFDGFNLSLHYTMDYQMILCFGINEGNKAFLRISDILGAFRRHEQQKTGAFNQRVYDEHLLMAKHYGYVDKYQAAGKLKWAVYRVRRAYWQIRRGGLTYFMGKVNTLLTRYFNIVKENSLFL